MKSGRGGKGCMISRTPPGTDTPTSCSPWQQYTIIIERRNKWDYGAHLGSDSWWARCGFLAGGPRGNLKRKNAPSTGGTMMAERASLLAGVGPPEHPVVTRRATLQAGAV